MAENEYRCEACNGIMEFDAVSQMLKCPNCDNQIPIFSDKEQVELHDLTLDAKRMNQPGQKATKTMECSGCGARIEVAGNETSARCPYCDSTYVLASEQAATLVPDGLLPFKIDKKDLGQKFGEWMKKKWLAPGELKNLYQRDQFQGLYIPYWDFDADADCNYTAMGGRNKTVRYKDSNGETKTRVETDWYHTHGHIHHNFRDVKIPASERFKKGLFHGIEPFHFNQLTPYSPDYFSGYMSENYTVGLDAGHRDAVASMKSDLTNMAAQDVTTRYDKVKDVRIRVNFRNETYKYVMLPIYATTYSYKDKKYTVLVNGQTGKFHGEYPKSPVKIAIIVVIILILAIVAYVSSRKDSDFGMLPQDMPYETVCIPEDVPYETGTMPEDMVYETVCIPEDMPYETGIMPEDMVYETVCIPEDVPYETGTMPEYMVYEMACITDGMSYKPVCLAGDVSWEIDGKEEAASYDTGT